MKPHFFNFAKIPLFIFLSLMAINAKSQCTQITTSDIPLTNEGPFIKTISSQPFTFTPAAENFVSMETDINSFDGLYVYNSTTGADETEVTISAPPGYSFDLNSFMYISDRDPDVNVLTLTLTFINGSTDTKTYSLSGNSIAHTINSFTTPANDVVSIKFATNALVYYNDFCIDDVKPFAVLPLTLLSFKGTVVADGISLQWKTANEINTKAFDIERADTDNNFTPVAGIPANASGGNYSYTDHNLIAGKPYRYRLKMRDINDLYKYSDVLFFQYPDLNSANKYALYPNPVTTDFLYLKVLNSNPAVIKAAVIDMSGRINYEYELNAAGSDLKLPVKQLASGTYLLQIRDKKGKLVQVSPFCKE